MAGSFQLFEAYGVELEYMIVDEETLRVKPLTDRVLYEVAGEYLAEIEFGEIAWSNELALHVIELKTNGPAASLAPLPELFQTHVVRINELLAPMGARLMPTGMHPCMDPDSELKLWPHEYNPIYEAYNRIFDCRGHGWANLQSVHLNLPFAGDEEFGRLLAAIRLLLPILPALAASSPLVDSRLTGWADNRLEVYRNNSRRIPSITADVVPEPVFTRGEYERQILQRMYDDIGHLDPDGVLRHEWLNARGAIARFDRNTIEIRVLDVQECPAADLAICGAIVEVLRAIIDERWTSFAEQQSLAVERLLKLFVTTIRDAERAAIDERWTSFAEQQSLAVERLFKLLVTTIRDAEQATIDDAAYLAHFGIRGRSIAAGDLWKHLMKEVSGQSVTDGPLQTVLREDSLSRRIERALGGDLTRIARIYRDLCDCLAEGRMFSTQ